MALARDFGTDIGPQAAESAAALTQSLAILETVSLGQLEKLVGSIGGTEGSLADVMHTATVAVIVFGEVASTMLTGLSDHIGRVVDGPVRTLAAVMRGDIVDAAKVAEATFGETFEAAMFGGFTATADVLVASYENATAAVEKFNRSTAKLSAPAAAVVTAAPTGPSPAAAGEAAPGSTESTDTAIRDLERLRAAQRKASEARCRSGHRSS